jgi:uncharacterized protein YneF (UPF0154 family)
MKEAQMPDDSDSQWGKVAGIGLEMAVGVALGYFVGKWLDEKFGWNGKATLIGTLAGIAGGMYLLIKQALAMNRDGEGKR